MEINLRLVHFVLWSHQMLTIVLVTTEYVSAA